MASEPANQNGRVNRVKKAIDTAAAKQVNATKLNGDNRVGKFLDHVGG